MDWRVNSTYTIGLNIQYHIVIGPHGLLPTCTWDRCTHLAPILPILPMRLQIGNQILHTNVAITNFSQMCQFVLVRDYTTENNAQVTKCIQ